MRHPHDPHNLTGQYSRKEAKKAGPFIRGSRAEISDILFLASYYRWRAGGAYPAAQDRSPLTGATLTKTSPGFYHEAEREALKAKARYYSRKAKEYMKFLKINLPA